MFHTISEIHVLNYDLFVYQFYATEWSSVSMLNYPPPIRRGRQMIQLFCLFNKCFSFIRIDLEEDLSSLRKWLNCIEKELQPLRDMRGGHWTDQQLKDKLLEHIVRTSIILYTLYIDYRHQNIYFKNRGRGCNTGLYTHLIIIIIIISSSSRVINVNALQYLEGIVWCLEISAGHPSLPKAASLSLCLCVWPIASIY